MSVLSYFPLSVLFLHCGLSKYLRDFATTKLPRIPRIVCDEFLCTMEISCVCAEIAIIRLALGDRCFVTVLFVVNVWWSNSFGTSTANPVIPLMDVLYDGGDVVLAACRLLGQFAAVPFAIRFSKIVWFWGLLKEHSELYDEASCQTDIQIWFGLAAIVELLITFTDATVRTITTSYKPEVECLLNSGVTTFLVYFAFSLSGGYFNPILATALTYGCSGSSFREHLMVYWISAIMGAISSKEMCRRYRTNKSPEKQE
ncbi:AQP11 (predicted) [Pycnogonum litorale]